MSFVYLTFPPFPPLQHTSTTANTSQLTSNDAINAPPEYFAYLSYCVAKAESEKAIWAYVKDQSPSYSVSVLLPALIFGPPIQPVTSVKKINYSSDVFYSLFNGTYETVPATSFPSYVSVACCLLQSWLVEGRAMDRQRLI
jgi:nucleoside-diphosphate-sugar epimerase